MHLYAPNITSEYSDEDPFKFYDIERTFQIHKLPYPKMKGNFLIYAFLASIYIRKLIPYIVISRSALPSMLSAIMGNNVIYESHAPVIKQNYISQFALKILVRLKHFFGLVVITESLKSYYLKNMAIPISKIKVLPDWTSYEKVESKLSNI